MTIENNMNSNDGDMMKLKAMHGYQVFYGTCRSTHDVAHEYSDYVLLV